MIGNKPDAMDPSLKLVRSLMLAIAALMGAFSLAPRAALAAPIVLDGGVQTFNFTDLPGDGPDEVTLEFQNGFTRDICDLLLSTDDSDNIDPDFEGDILVRDAGGTDLQWNETPAPGDGVETIKTKSPNPPQNCIPAGKKFTVKMKFDEVDNGDILKISPTDKDAGQMLAWATGQGCTNEYALFNGYNGLPGATQASFVSFNATGMSLGELEFSSTNASVNVVSASSSIPSTFEPVSGVLAFVTPIQTGSAVDYTFTLDQLIPFVEGDPDPFTRIHVTAPCGVGGIVGLLSSGPNPSDRPAVEVGRSGRSYVAPLVIAGLTALALVGAVVFGRSRRATSRR